MLKKSFKLKVLIPSKETKSFEAEDNLWFERRSCRSIGKVSELPSQMPDFSLAPYPR